MKNGSFITDLIATFPLDLILYPVFPTVWIQAVLRLPRVLWFTHIFEYFDLWEQYSFKYVQSIRLFKLLVGLLLVIHWIGCLYIGLGYWLGFGGDAYVNYKSNILIYSDGYRNSLWKLLPFQYN